MYVYNYFKVDEITSIIDSHLMKYIQGNNFAGGNLILRFKYNKKHCLSRNWYKFRKAKSLRMEFIISYW